MNPLNFRKQNVQLIGVFAALGVAAAVSLLVPAAPARAASAKAVELPPIDLAAGKEAFTVNCARCHGETGEGDGPDAKRMDPKPRKLSEGTFKFRTTASGTLPTDFDLFHTVSEGLPGSKMPEFNRLPDDIRWQMVYYIKTLSPAFGEENSKPEPVAMGTDPGPKANIAKGKELYTSLGCVACHGANGRGNGPSAPTLVDNWGDPIRAADLTQGWNYRAGGSPKDIVARMLTGIDGTPMPSYADAVSSKEDAWHLAYYVASLQEEPLWGRTVVATKTATLPSSADDAAWKTAKRTDVHLGNQLYLDGKYLPTRANAISVQAVYNEDSVVFRLSWHDPDESREAPSDAVGIALIPERSLKWELGSLRSWPAVENAPELDLNYWSAQRNGAQQAVAKSTSDLEAGKGEAQTLESQAAYDDGRWTVILKRPVPDTKKTHLIGLAVWDGGNQEQGRRRSNSNWINLALK
jgi:cytochrome c oxidase cbb3-type subunit 2